MAVVGSFNLLTVKSSPLCFGYHISSCSKALFTTANNKFGSVNKKNRIQISVCKSSATSTSASLLSFRDLDADDFRHPLDKQLSELHQLMVQSAEALKIEAPDLYVPQSPIPNAYTLAINGKKPFVVVHTSLIELLTRKELQAVLAHELGHLKCDHGVWLKVANILTVGAYTIPVLKPIPAPVSSPVWYEDLVTPTQPMNQQTPVPDSSLPESSTTSPIPNDVEPVVEPVVEQSIPTFEPVFGTTSNTQSEGVRRSSRAIVKPSWLKDFVTPNLPRANQFYAPHQHMPQGSRKIYLTISIRLGIGGMIAQNLEEQLFRWLRAAELTCDRAALLVVQDPKVVISVLMKLAGGSPSLADQLNVDAFLEQARSYDRASASPVGWYIRLLSHGCLSLWCCLDKLSSATNLAITPGSFEDNVTTLPVIRLHE
ncbi:peptidase family M48 family protein [Artemisia annua]|uniref:Peptidase family M48 family protein n=1 Tax=Artemisia annua TaxID=35608 RepID=A0A2U1QL86_ARTAN|nr:peptidase family M48 family protein [Artemisia annua]